jgi:L-asparaginase
MDPMILEDLLKRGYKGIVVQGAGPGNLPTEPDFSETIRALAAQGIPVVLVSQCEKGSAEIEMYEVGKKMKDAGAISGKDMTTEAALSKLIWVMSQDGVKALKGIDAIESIRQLMEKDVAGELSE